MASKTKTAKAAGMCEVIGCSKPAVWEATKLFGKGGTICTCDGCRPGSISLSPALQAALKGRTFYDVRPIGGGR